MLVLELLALVTSLYQAYEKKTGFTSDWLEI